ncbi:SDR family oxidoreductase [Marinifilum fragile]|uniref:NAD-dependent epimerase/dehydratase family protein n=1 Tax=Marinifilum fragile TaxID=570161 RepID=UPI002AA7059E|nr:SDR family oxidoreductase [Marinifilum fragile]
MNRTIINPLMKKCAIIGASGYIGKHLSFYMKNLGINVELYDIVDSPGYIKIDLTSKESISKINLDMDYLFLFSGLTGTHAGFTDYEKFIEINELGLLNLLDTIRNSPYRPKIIFPSTRLVYKGSDNPLKEEDTKETKTVYAVNKLACEGLLDAYRNSFGIPYTVFRLCVPYGNLISTDYSFGTIGFFIKQVKAGNNISLYGGGEIKRTFTHIEDVCYQIVKGGFVEKSDGRIYNIGGETLSLKDAAVTIANKFNQEVEAVPWPDSDLRIESGHTYFDDSKIQSLIKMPPYKKLFDFAKDL